MAKKFFTDESLATFVDEIKTYTDEAVSTKSDTSHAHTINDVNGLQSALDSKANATDVAYIDIEDNENIEYTESPITSIIIDDILSETSVNPVQNKVITNELSRISEDIAELKENGAKRELVKELVFTPVDGETSTSMEDDVDIAFLFDGSNYEIEVELSPSATSGHPSTSTITLNKYGWYVSGNVADISKQSNMIYYFYNGAWLRIVKSYYDMIGKNNFTFIDTTTDTLYIHKLRLYKIDN